MSRNSPSGTVQVQVPAHRLDRASRDQIRRGMPHFVLALGAYYLFLTGFHLLVSTAETSTVVALACLATALGAFGVNAILRVRPIPRKATWVAVVVAAAVIVANITLYQVLSGDARNSVNYALVNVVAGLLIHDRRVVVGILAVSSMAWMLAVQFTPTADPVFEGGFLLGTWVLSLGMASTRRQTLVVQESLRLEAEMARDRAERRLEQRDRAILAHQRSQDGLRLLIEFCRDGVLIVQDGQVSYANQAFRQRLGLTRSAVFDRRLSELVAPEDVDMADHRFLRKEARDGVEMRFMDLSGNAVTLEVTSARVEYGDGPAVLLLCADPADREQPDREALANRMLAVGTLAAGVAHEINNPLAYTLANLEMLLIELRDGGDPEQIELVEVALEGAGRVKDIVADLRTFSREDEESVLAVEVEELLETSIRMAWNEIRHRANLVRDFQAPPPVMANPSRLGQVFLNLLVNAAQAIEDGDATGQEIRVHTYADDGHTVVAISDTGVGMGRMVQEQIFRPFYTTKPVGVGTGLGLPFCREVVEGLGGRIEVESEPGAGTTFRVRLPSTELIATPLPADLIEPLEPSGGPSRRILVVDDEAAMGEAIAAVLSEHQVEVVENGHRALERLAEDTWDAVLCDIMMPELPGPEVFRRAVAVRPELAPRFAFITGGTFTPSARAFLEETSHPVLVKPFRAQKIRELVDQLLEAHDPSV